MQQQIMRPFGIIEDGLKEVSIAFTDVMSDLEEDETSTNTEDEE